MSLASQTCPLCAHQGHFFTTDRKRRYFQCSECELVFADVHSQISAAEEKEIYDLHQNSPDDDGYRAFLSQLTAPLLERVPASAQGLDFGCGPGPTLHLMLEAAGMQMRLYDIFYAPHPAVLERTYDFVTCTEVVEHFNAPAQSWLQLVGLLAQRGWLAVMTSLFTRATPEAFLAWQYKNDPTHVCFYTPQTMRWIAQHYGLACEIINQRVILFQRDSAVMGG